MALIADDPRDRAEQLAIVTERLAVLIADETRRLRAREAPLTGAEAEERTRLANAYRLELARIKQDPSLIQAAPSHLHARLKAATLELQAALEEHDTELGALKLVTEGLVQAMAEEVTRQRGGGRNYGARGSLQSGPSPGPALIDRSA